MEQVRTPHRLQRLHAFATVSNNHQYGLLAFDIVERAWAGFAAAVSASEVVRAEY